MNAARSLFTMANVAAVAAATFALASCSPPEPPSVKPISGRVTTIDANGITVEAKLETHNPNDFDIKVTSFTATIVLDNKHNIGTVSSVHSITLPANKKKVIDLPIALKWNDVAAIAPLALANRDVPYEASGNVKVGAKSVDLELPFKVSGVLTHAQIVSAVGSAIPKIPGLPF